MSEHANGAKSVIARTVQGGGAEVDDYWYEVANNVLDALTAEGYVVAEDQT